MICLDKKIIFIHIPRCAGISIKDYLKTISQEYNETSLKLNEYEATYNIDLHDFFIFTCVRNPYDRLFSMFRHKKFNRKTKDTENKNYAEWVLLTKDKEWLGGVPQSMFLLNEKDVEVHILKFENLKKDFNKMLKKLELKRYKLEHINEMGATNGYILSKELEKKIYNKYQVDFETFGYNRNEGLLKRDDK